MLGVRISHSHVRKVGWVVVFPFYRGKKLKFKETAIHIQSKTNTVNKGAKSYGRDTATFLKSPADIKTLKSALGLITDMCHFLSFQIVCTSVGLSVCFSQLCCLFMLPQEHPVT